MTTKGENKMKVSKTGQIADSDISTIRQDLDFLCWRKVEIVAECNLSNVIHM